jgi:hypothetical protein
MNISGFLHQDNISTLWEVISDEEIFKFLPKDSQSKISQVFLNNVRGFFETEKTKTTNLVDMNKKYIILILAHIKQHFVPQMPNKIKISDEPSPKELITYEEIHTDRQSQFEKDLSRRQDEFTRTMTLTAPQAPDFTDKVEDKPIEGMDRLIKEMTAKRNYEVEQINRNYTSDINQTSNWLKPQETSVKTDKFPAQQDTTSSASRFKFLNLDEQLGGGGEQGKKNVTWGANKEISATNLDSTDDELETNIFKKLKRVGPEPAAQNNIQLSLHEARQEDRLANMERQIAALASKMEALIELLMSAK